MASVCEGTGSEVQTAVNSPNASRLSMKQLNHSHPLASFPSVRGSSGAPSKAEDCELAPADEKDVEVQATPIPGETYYPDGGLVAWSVVFGAWILVACFLGFGLSTGLFIAHYQTYSFPDTSPTVLQFLGGVLCFTQNATAFVAGRLGERFGYKRVIAIGAVGTVLSLLTAAFCEHSLPGLFITQGVGLGFSNGLAMPLAFAIPSHWFKRRRGLATGLATSGAGLGGGISTLIIRYLLTELGPKKTLLIYAGIQAVALLAGWCLVRVRDVPENRMPKNWLPKGIWRNVSWYSMSGSVFLGVFGFLPPYFLITQYTQAVLPDLTPGSYLAAVPLTMMNFSAGFGRIAAGFIADRIGAVNCLFISFFVGGLSQMVMWPFVKSFGSITGFAIISGFFGSWFMSLLAVACSRLFGGHGLATMTGFMILANSPGQLLGSTVATSVLQASGQEWWAVCVTSGGLMLLGGVAVLPARFKGQKKLFGKI